jgi:hypothetical protein
MISFIVEVIRKELKFKKEKLRKAYRASNKDPGQLDTKEWENTLADETDFPQIGEVLLDKS